MRADLSYDTVAIIFHWAIAFLILVAFGLGLTVDDFPKTWSGAVVNVHALIGLSVLILSFARLGWRLFHIPPELPPSIGRITRRVSSVLHFALYCLMILVPLIGVPTLLFRGRGLDFGLFEIISPFGRTPEIYRPLTTLHEFAAYALIGLAAGHVLAAFYHQFVRRDGVLRRMLPILRGQ